MVKSNLAWSNITRDSLTTDSARDAWDAFMQAKATLETELALEAKHVGAAEEGDAFKYSYRSIGQGSIGVAIAEVKAERSAGFAGLRRPRPSLDAYQRNQDNGGYRR